MSAHRLSPAVQYNSSGKYSGINVMTLERGSRSVFNDFAPRSAYLSAPASGPSVEDDHACVDESRRRKMKRKLTCDPGNILQKERRPLAVVDKVMPPHLRRATVNERSMHTSERQHSALAAWAWCCLTRRRASLAEMGCRSGNSISGNRGGGPGAGRASVTTTTIRQARLHTQR